MPFLPFPFHFLFTTVFRISGVMHWWIYLTLSNVKVITVAIGTAYPIAYIPPLKLYLLKYIMKESFLFIFIYYWPEEEREKSVIILLLFEKKFGDNKVSE